MKHSDPTRSALRDIAVCWATAVTFSVSVALGSVTLINPALGMGSAPAIAFHRA